MNRCSPILAGLATLMVPEGGALAATQGTVGATSTGSITITLSVAQRVRIGGLSDVSLAAVSPDETATAAQSVCVWSNTATRGYSVTASGSGGGGAFVLASGAQSTRYDVAWNGSAGQGSGTRLAPGSPLAGQTSSAITPDCAAGPSASLTVSVEASELRAAQAEATYLGTLNLLVSPE